MPVIKPAAAEMAAIAAAVQGEGIFSGKPGSVGRKDFIFADDGSDFAGEYRAFESAEAMQFDPRRCSQLGVHGRGAREVAQGLDRLETLAKRAGWAWTGTRSSRSSRAACRYRSG